MPPRPGTNKPLVKPAKVRYWKGKAPAANADSDSDSDSDGKENAPIEIAKPDDRVVAGGAGRIIQQGDAKIKVKLGDVKVEGGKVLIGGKVPLVKNEIQDPSGEEETDSEDEKPTIPLPKLPGDDESSEYETDSEEESEEEKKPAFRPMFVPKKARDTVVDAAQAEKDAEEAARREEEMIAERKLASKELAGETIRRELAEKEATDLIPDVDDTDGLDPTTEFEEWRARELSRLLRDKQAQAAIDEEREEIERRRAMPEEQRLREDEAYAQSTRDKEKTQLGFLQKYYHKGAFHQEDDLLQRDYNVATESAVDMSFLPKVMQVRDFGKMSRTKYTHLADQDTTAGGWGKAAIGAPGTIGTTTTGCWNCGGPHLRADCPNNNINDIGGLGLPGPGGFGGAPSYGNASGGYGGSGAGGPGDVGTSSNTSALGGGGVNRWGGDDKNTGSGGGRAEKRDKDRESGKDRDSGRDGRREREERGGRYRDEGRERRFDDERRNERRRSRSRSRSPREKRDRHHRERDEQGGRDRDRDREREREKRRGDERDRESDRSRDKDKDRRR